ncbi:MAG: hypothetical protein K2P81_14410 [Bacteriovoracaceae bacterium]|nr:hypothetical protein [Bacteriovoracaceae bacterium]
MRFIITTILLSLLSSLSFAAMECVPTDSEAGLATCAPVPGDDVPSANGCSSPSGEQTSTADEIANEYAQSDAPVMCDETVWGKKGEALDEKAKEKKLKELAKQCKKEAKAYKKAVLNSLMKDGKLGQALQVVFKRKRKIMRGSGQNGDLKLDADIAQMTPAQIKAFIMDEMKKKYPDADKVDKKGRTIAQSNTTPFNMMIKAKNGKLCKISANDFPKEEPFAPKECLLCEPIDIQSSFTSDCSYMVNPSQGLTESVAHEIMGINSSNQKEFCQPEDMAKAKNDLSEINKLAGKLCDKAKEGKEPSLTIETARNLFNDKTPQLALKRGQFIQKYLQYHLKKNCKIDGEIPSWIEDQNEFAENIKVQSPVYGETANNFDGWKEGDYGPSPYAATPGESETEILKYQKNMAREKADLITQRDAKKLELKTVKDEIAGLVKEIKGSGSNNGMEAMYAKIKADLPNVQKNNPSLVDPMSQQLTELGNQALANYNKKHFLQQKASDLETKIQVLEKKISEHDQKSNSKVAALKGYYQNPAQGDKAVFEEFKMVRIKGEEDQEDEELPPVAAEFDADVKKSLNAALKLQTYSCQLNAIETHKASIEGVLKGALKVVTIATLPVVAAGGAVAASAAMPFTTTWSLLCKGCGDPGSTPPILQLGNLTMLDLSKSGRSRAWGDTKEFVRNYVNWGGTLKIKNNKNVTLHDLKKYHPTWDLSSPEEQGNVVDEYFKKNFPQEFAASLGQQDTPAVACSSSEVAKTPGAIPVGAQPTVPSSASQQ